MKVYVRTLILSTRSLQVQQFLLGVSNCCNGIWNGTVNVHVAANSYCRCCPSRLN